MLIARKLYNQKDFACCFSDRKGPWPTFCCLGHSDVNSHFKNFNTSNTSFTLGEPHKLKLIQYFRIHLYAIVSDIAHFLIPFGMRERNGLFRTVFHLY